MEIDQTMAGFDSLLDGKDLEVVEQKPDLGGAAVTNDDITVTDPITEEGNTEPEENENIIYKFLQDRGIEDPSKLKYENDEGEIEDVDFNTLSAEEQLTILKEVTDAGLSDYEINVVNYLRRNNTTLEDVIKYYQDDAIAKYLEDNPDQIREQSFAVDQYSDDEIFLAEIKAKYPLLTDEEIGAELQAAKENDATFKKKVDTLREMYKSEEENQRALKEQELIQQQEALRDNLYNAISALDEIALDYEDPKSETIVIEDSDKNAVLSYILDQDSDGKSQFVRDIENPEMLVKVGLLMLQGDDIISGITQYYKDTIKADRKELAKLKAEVEKLKGSTPTNKTVVVQSPNNADDKKSASMVSLWENNL